MPGERGRGLRLLRCGCAYSAARMASILWIAIAPEFRLRGHMVAAIRPLPAVGTLLALIFSTAVAVAILPIVIAVSHFVFLTAPRAWPQSPHSGAPRFSHDLNRATGCQCLQVARYHTGTAQSAAPLHLADACAGVRCEIGVNALGGGSHSNVLTIAAIM